MFALIGNALLCYTVLFLRTLASLMTDRCAVSVADYILAILSRVPVQVTFEVLDDLTVLVKYFTVVKLAA